jgi:large subunit ribosomal protein L30e
MSIVDNVQKALKNRNVIIGYKKSLEFIKNDSPKTIVMSQNIPDRERQEVEHNAKLSGAKIEIFEGSSKDLGVICGKPFPIMLLVIKS